MRVPAHTPQSGALYGALIAKPGHIGKRVLTWEQRVSWAEQVAELRAQMMWSGYENEMVRRRIRTPHTTKLNPARVLSIRQAVGTLAEIGGRHGVSATTAGEIRRFETWRHV